MKYSVIHLSTKHNNPKINTITTNIEKEMKCLEEMRLKINKLFI